MISTDGSARRPPSRWSKGRVASLGVALAALTAAAVGVGIGLGASGGGGPVRPDGAADSAPPPTATAGDASGSRPVILPDGSHVGPLSGFLMAVPGSYQLGQDVPPIGPEGDVPAGDFATVLDEVSGDAAAGYGVSRMAVLSLAGATEVGTEAGSVTSSVTVVLEQAAPAAASFDYTRLVGDASAVPAATAAAVPGFPTARCFTDPGHAASTTQPASLPAGWCVGLSTDVVTFLTETSTEPVNGGTLGGLVGEQLSRLTPIPGA